jgi:hypothetical protein
MCLSQHQRSQSLSPESEFLPISKDHIASLLINPPQRQAPQPPESPILSPVSAWPLPNMTPTWSVYSSTYNPTRPLSPILSPIEGTTPVPGSPISGATFMQPPPTPSKAFLSPSPLPDLPPPIPEKVSNLVLGLTATNLK